MKRISIQTAKAPSSVAPLSQGTRKGPLLQVSGQLPYDPESGALEGTTVAEQTKRVLKNVAAVLEAANSSMDDVIMLRVYLTSPAHLTELNEAYSSFVGPTPPARTTVYMELPVGILVEIDALAVLGD